MARIETELWIAAPRERVFDLCRSVEAHVASTSRTGERAIGGVTSGLLGLGDEVTWSARHLGFRRQLTSRITQFDRPRHFRDSQVRGAFRRFHHDHIFEDCRCGTLMRDVFDYAAAYGLIGRELERLLLTPYMRRFLLARAHAVKGLAESERWRAFLGHYQASVSTNAS